MNRREFLWGLLAVASAVIAPVVIRRRTATDAASDVLVWVDYSPDELANEELIWEGWRAAA